MGIGAKSLVVDAVFVGINDIRVRMVVQFHNHFIEGMLRQTIVVIHQRHEFAARQFEGGIWTIAVPVEPRPFDAGVCGVFLQGFGCAIRWRSAGNA